MTTQHRQGEEAMNAISLNTQPAGEFRPLPGTPETEAQKAVRRVADAVHRVNDAIIRAVGAGISVELVRVSRYHDGLGNWGDQIVPTVREPERGE
jgi:hypothetical protein